MAEGEIRQDKTTRLSRLELEDTWMSEVLASANSWTDLEEQAQCLSLLREFRETGKLTKHPEMKILPRIVYELCVEVPTMSSQQKNQYCGGLAKDINDWLSEQFFNIELTSPIVMFPLIPSCTNRNDHVKHLYQCEARFAFQRDPKTNAPVKRRVPPTPQCPRGVAHCPHITSGYGHGHSHLWPIMNLPWWKWTLHELIAHAKLDYGSLVKSFELRNGDGDGLVNAIGGEINRLNEIRERCKCRECSNRLEFNKKYSIKDAVYRATTTKECSTLECVGPSVYLSHCSGCGNIIDSRDSRFQDKDNYYVCISCASGKDLEIAGRQCPQCNGINTLRGNYRNKQCKECKHKVQLPFASRRGKFSSGQESNFDQGNVWPKDLK